MTENEYTCPVEDAGWRTHFPGLGIVDISPSEPVAARQEASGAAAPPIDQAPLEASWPRAIGVGLTLTLAQLAFTLFMSMAVARLSLDEAYRGLAFGDSGWYANIMERGYQSSVPPVTVDRASNVAFFPGYPWLARGVQAVLGISPELALLLTAQLCCWASWTYFLLLLQAWRVTSIWATVAVFTALTHPVAYYLICGYSESLFLMTLLGFIYWSERQEWWAGLLAAAHGFLMTATRLVGVPLVVYPLWQALRPGSAARAVLGGRRLVVLLPAALVSGAAALGAILFFVYCHWRFGQWNIYMETQWIGWQVVPDYLGPLDFGYLFNSPYADRSYWPVLDRGAQWRVHSLSRLSMPFLGVTFLAIAWLELRVARAYPSNGLHARLGLYLGAALLLYVPATGLIHAKIFMQSMVRYAFCVHVLLVLALARLSAEVPPLPAPRQRRVIRGVLAYNAVALSLQAWCVTATADGIWFA